MKVPGSDLSFLAACLAGHIPDIAERDWEGLIRAAAHEFVLPSLSHRLAEIGLVPPADIAEYLAAVEDLNCQRNTRILEELREISWLLNRVGIEPVALKGAAFLLAGVYPRPGCRYLCDLDLLVPHSQLGAAAEVLERDGYVQDGRDALGRFRHHYPQLQRPSLGDGSGSAPVELHHSFGHGISRKLLSGEDVLERSTVMEWNGVRIRIPAPEHLVTHLILHSQVHHSYSERIWPPLRAMYDITVLQRRFGQHLDWEQVQQRFAAGGQKSALLLHLLHVREALGMPLPFAFDLGPLGRLRWARRRALNRWPMLRVADPLYLASATLSRRIRFLSSILSAPGGWKFAARTFSRPDFYRRLLAEIVLR